MSEIDKLQVKQLTRAYEWAIKNNPGGRISDKDLIKGLKATSTDPKRATKAKNKTQSMKHGGRVSRKAKY